MMTENNSEIRAKRMLADGPELIHGDGVRQWKRTEEEGSLRNSSKK
jgi:hypothetical protein